MVWIFPIACEGLAQYRIQRFLHPSIENLASTLLFNPCKDDVRRFDMPTAQVESHHGYKPLDRILNLWHWEEGFGVCHETAMIVVSSSLIESVSTRTL